MSAPARHYQAGGPCCDGNPPVWTRLGYGGYKARPDWMTIEQEDALCIIDNGGIVRKGKLVPVPVTTPPILGVDGNILYPDSPVELVRVAYPAAQAVIQAGLGLDANGRDLGSGTRTDRVRDIGGRAHVLWCNACKPTAWEQFGEDLGHTVDAVAPVVRGIAIACSYIPVFGTAVSFVLNTSLSIAQGQSIDKAAMDALGSSLPGQPWTHAAFEACRAVFQGEPLDDALLEVAAGAAGDAVPSEVVKKSITGAVHIARSIADGNVVTSAVLDEMYDQLPPEGKAAMGTARRLLNGDNVFGSMTEEAKVAAIFAINDAKAKGEAGMNLYVAEAGYQGSLSALPPNLQAGVNAGIMAGNIEEHQFIGTFDAKEKNVQSNDALYAKGKQIVDAGAVWNLKKVSDLLKANTFTVTLNVVDTMSGANKRVPTTVTMDDAWRRGFYIAMGACGEGLTEDSSALQHIRASLGNMKAMSGFDAGQAVQQQRAKGPFANSRVTDTVSSTSHGYLAGLIAAKPKAINLTQNALPSFDAFNSAPAVRQQTLSKASERGKWVTYYRRLGGHSSGTMTG